jgi:hypothetical protein
MKTRRGRAGQRVGILALVFTLALRSALFQRNVSAQYSSSVNSASTNCGPVTQANGRSFTVGNWPSGLGAGDEGLIEQLVSSALPDSEWCRDFGRGVYQPTTYDVNHATGGSAPRGGDLNLDLAAKLRVSQKICHKGKSWQITALPNSWEGNNCNSVTNSLCVMFQCRLISGDSCSNNGTLVFRIVAETQTGSCDDACPTSGSEYDGYLKVGDVATQQGLPRKFSAIKAASSNNTLADEANVLLRAYDQKNPSNPSGIQNLDQSQGLLIYENNTLTELTLQQAKAANVLDAHSGAKVCGIKASALEECDPSATQPGMTELPEAVPVDALCQCYDSYVDMMSSEDVCDGPGNIPTREEVCADAQNTVANSDVAGNPTNVIEDCGGKATDPKSAAPGGADGTGKCKSTGSDGEAVAIAIKCGETKNCATEGFTGGNWRIISGKGNMSEAIPPARAACGSGQLSEQEWINPDGGRDQSMRGELCYQCQENCEEQEYIDEDFCRRSTSGLADYETCGGTTRRGNDACTYISRSVWMGTGGPIALSGFGPVKAI